MIKFFSWTSFFVGGIVLLALCVSCASSEPVTSLPQVSDTPSAVQRAVFKEVASFRLHILDRYWRSGLGYTRESAWPVWMEIDLSENSIWVITEDDIEIYDWSRNTITLTREASIALREAFSEEDFFGWRVGKQVFVVTLNDEWLYGGVFSEPMSAAAIHFPMLYPDFDGSKITLHLTPGLVALDEMSGIIDRQEVRDFFYDLGKLIE